MTTTRFNLISLARTVWISLLLTGCFHAELIGPAPGGQAKATPAQITSVALTGDTLILSGTSLGTVTAVNLVDSGGTHHPLRILSQSAGSLSAKSSATLPLSLGAIYDLIVTNAAADSSASVSFQVAPGSITPAMLDRTYLTSLGSSFTGTLTAPANGLSVGTDQLVVSGGNVGIGTASPATKLDIAGAYGISGVAVLGIPDGDTSSLAVGEGALTSQSATGLNNTALGNLAGQNITTGSSNTAIGQQAMMGSSSYPNTGGNNTAIGYRAGYGILAGGNSNTAIGAYALTNSENSTSNIAIGTFSLGSMTSGSNNTAIGNNAGYLDNGSGSIYIGSNAGYNDTGSNDLFINSVQESSLANDKAYSLLYGTFSGTAGSLTGQQLVINGNVGIGTTNPTANLHVNSTTAQDALDVKVNNGTLWRFDQYGCFSSSQGLGMCWDSNINQYAFTSFATNTYITSGPDNATSANIVMQPAGSGLVQIVGSGTYTGTWTSSSDSRYKKNIAAIPDALDKTLKLRGIEFEYRVDEFPRKKFESGKQVGLIAQEVEKVVPEVVRTDGEGYKSVAYDHLTALLIESVKTLSSEVEALKSLTCPDHPTAELCRKSPR